MNKAKIKILDREFNDKMFWQMFDPTSALEYFIPTAREWQQLGIEFTLQDTNLINKYMRHIEIWAEGDEKLLNLMLLKGVV